MNYRRLRIASSSMCGVACLAMIAMWVRSNSYLDEFWVSWPAKRGLGLLSAWSGASVAVQNRDKNPDSYIVGFSSLELKYHERIETRSLLGFHAGRDSDIALITVPYWFLSLSFGVASALILRLEARFSLRTLLIATTAIAMLVGLAVFVLRS
jgi:hypothetical protein